MTDTDSRSEPSSEARELVRELHNTHVWAMGFDGAGEDQPDVPEETVQRWRDARDALLDYIAALEARTEVAIYTEDGRRYCQTCGTEVEVVGSDEGTSYYRPVEEEVLAKGVVQRLNPGGAILGVIHIASGEVKPGQEFRIIRDTSREERDG